MYFLSSSRIQLLVLELSGNPFQSGSQAVRKLLQSKPLCMGAGGSPGSLLSHTYGCSKSVKEYFRDHHLTFLWPFWRLEIESGTSGTSLQEVGVVAGFGKAQIKMKSKTGCSWTLCERGQHYQSMLCFPFAVFYCPVVWAQQKADWLTMKSKVLKTQGKCPHSSDGIIKPIQAEEMSRWVLAKCFPDGEAFLWIDLHRKSCCQSPMGLRRLRCVQRCSLLIGLVYKPLFTKLSLY